LRTAEPPEYIKQVQKRLVESGYAAYLVGGCVRDSILGRPVHDWDITTSATPEVVESLFTRAILTGKEYGTVTVVVPECTVEVTTFRTEGGYRDGRRPSFVGFVRSLDEDLSRRDFTMNAIAASISGELTDPFGGLADIESRVIRCVGVPDERFSEDALRMLRAFRFSAELGFAVDADTLSSISRNAGLVSLISAERVSAELEKTLLSQSPEICGEIIKAGLLARYMSTPEKHSGSLGRLNAIAELPAEAALRWCAFCALLTESGSVTSAKAFLRDMRLDSKTVGACSRGLEIAGCYAGFNAYDNTGVKRLLSEHGIPAVRCAAAAFDVLGGGPHYGPALAVVDEIVGCGECFHLSGLAVSGSDLISLGHAPGPGLGGTLSSLLRHVIEHPEDNTREALMKIIEETDKK